jgi:hypothetical protein
MIGRAGRLIGFGGRVVGRVVGFIGLQMGFFGFFWACKLFLKIQPRSAHIIVLDFLGLFWAILKPTQPLYVIGLINLIFFSHFFTIRPPYLITFKTILIYKKPNINANME